MSQAAQSQNSGIQNSAQPTRNKNIEIENVSSPGQTISLIRNRRINQDTLENQNETLDIIAIPEVNIVNHTEDTAVHSRASHNGINSADASGSISEASVQVQDESEDGASQADTIPCDNLRSPVSNKKQKEIVVHRLKLKEDIINEFKKVDINDKIVFKVIDQAGRPEEGVGVGVERDIYSGAWQEMLDSLCVGTHARVPFVRHDLYFEEWEALGNVLLHGFSSCRYFPVLLSEAFIMHCLFGEAPNDVLIDSFLKYLSTSESEVVEAALHCKRYVSTIFHFGDWAKVPKNANNFL